MSNNPDFLQLAQLVENLRAELQLRASFESEPRFGLHEKGFDDLKLDLASASLIAGTQLNAGGYEISYLRRPSAPGGLLLVSAGAGIVYPMGPGDKIEGRFDAGRLMVKRAPGSATVGPAILRVSQNPQARFYERQNDDLSIEPTALLGTYVGGVVTFVAVAENDSPSGAAAGVTGAFGISGWSRLLVLIDCGAALNVTSFQLNPFYQTPDGTLWFDQGGTELISVADSNPTSGRYRMVEVNLSQAQGSLYLAIRNLLLAAATGLSFCVLGVA